MAILKYWPICNRNQHNTGVIKTISYIYATVNLIQFCGRESQSKYSSCWCSECSICFHISILLYPSKVHALLECAIVYCICHQRREIRLLNQYSLKAEKACVGSKDFAYCSFVECKQNNNQKGKCVTITRYSGCGKLILRYANVQEIMNCWDTFWDLA